MKRSIVTILLAAASTSSIAASHVKSGYVACLTSDQFSQLAMAASRHDKRGIDWLMSNGCVPTSDFENDDFSLLGYPGMGQARIRVYLPNGKAFEAVTFSEAIPEN